MGIGLRECGRAGVFMRSWIWYRKVGVRVGLV